MPGPMITADMPVDGIKLTMKKRGALSNIIIIDVKRPTHVPDGMVLVNARAVGLNFRDVLNVLGEYPGDPGEPGGDFAGIILAVGAGVTTVKPGDKVMGNGTACLSSFVLTSQYLVAPMPSEFSYAQASMLPTVFSTVEVGLGLKANLQKGQRVLIHAAAGGVGIAAIQFAQRVGAEVYATAGSSEKHDYLRSIGVKNITNSRDSDAFLAGMREMLGPEKGVHVVLNSLSGDFISHSVDLLETGGHFVEIGKRNIWTKEKMASVRPDLKYTTIAWDGMMENEAEVCHEVLTRVSAAGEGGHIWPMPHKTFDMRSGGMAAFRLLRQGKNLGKVVLEIEDPADTANVEWQKLQKATSGIKLTMKKRGALSNIIIIDVKRPTHVPDGMVLVNARAVGLNFRDVLNVLGEYPGDPGEPGGDFAGIILAVGAGVTTVKPGDKVMGNGTACLSSFVLTSQYLVAPMPSEFSYAQASMLPTVFSTVEVGLGLKANLQKGQRVLIHAAAGGVGIAAIQFAHRVGAEVYATAGSSEKHDYLRSIGVKNITNSRDSDAFLAGMREMLGPEKGVHVVLNSLSGDFISHSVDLLETGGHFVEIGKRNIWTKEKMASVRPDLKYTTIAWDGMMENEAEVCHEVLTRVSAAGEGGHIWPMPHKTFDMRSGGMAAFRLLRQGKNLGKVVLEIEDPVASGNK